MGDWTSEGKNPVQIVRDMEGLGHISIENPLPRTMSAAIQVKLVAKLCETIDTASRDLLRQSSELKEYIEAVRKDFVEQSVTFRKCLEAVQGSLEEFRKSNETASKALTKATYVLAFVALVQAAILAYPLLK